MKNEVRERFVANILKLYTHGMPADEAAEAVAQWRDRVLACYPTEGHITTGEWDILYSEPSDDEEEEARDRIAERYPMLATLCDEWYSMPGDE